MGLLTPLFANGRLHYKPKEAAAQKVLCMRGIGMCMNPNHLILPRFNCVVNN